MTKLQIATLASELLKSEVREEWLWDELCADFLFAKERAEDYFNCELNRTQFEKDEAIRDCMLSFCESHIATEFNIPVPRRTITNDKSGAMILDIGLMFRDNSGVVTIRPNYSNCTHSFQECNFGTYQGYEKCIHCKEKRAII